MTRVLVLCIAIAGLSACNAVRNTAGAIGVGSSTPFRTVLDKDGVRYRAQVKAGEDDRRDMAISVSPFATDPEAALSTASFAANRYCILVYGGSDKTWTVGPDAPVDQLAIDDDTATLLGRCTQR